MPESSSLPAEAPREIPAEAVRAVSEKLRAWEVDQSGEGDIAPVEEFDADALELLTPAAPLIAAQALRDAAEIAHLTGTDGASGARSPTARATWRMVAEWLRARADLARTEPTKETNRAT